MYHKSEHSLLWHWTSLALAWTQFHQARSWVSSFEPACPAFVCSKWWHETAWFAGWIGSVQRYVERLHVEENAKLSMEEIDVFKINEDDNECSCVEWLWILLLLTFQVLFSKFTWSTLESTTAMDSWLPVRSTCTRSYSPSSVPLPDSFCSSHIVHLFLKLCDDSWTGSRCQIVSDSNCIQMPARTCSSLPVRSLNASHGARTSEIICDTWLVAVNTPDEN